MKVERLKQRDWVQHWKEEAIPEQKAHELFCGPALRDTGQKAVRRYNTWSLSEGGLYLQSTMHYCECNTDGREEPHRGSLPMKADRLKQHGWIQRYKGEAIPELELWKLFCHHPDPFRDTGQKGIRRYNAWSVPACGTHLQPVMHYREYSSSHYEEYHRFWRILADK
jgi:hypothetical protein